ncbi:MAG TPA: hypothetical protein PKJ15_08440, partial [Methanomassiliicoccales archaeon]|nr:hypothetical protein [Methanomassiliicoccales archaeon]
KAICFHTPDPVNYLLENINVRNNYISGTGKMIFGTLAGPGWGDGIQFHQLGRNVLIDGNYIEDVYRCAIQVKGDHFIVSNNILNDTRTIPFGTSTFVSTISLTDSSFINNIVNTPLTTHRNQTIIWSCDNSVVSNNLITGGGYTGATSASLQIAGSSIAINGNIVDGSNAAQAGIRLVNVRNATLSNCIVSNPARNLGSGIDLTNCRYLTITSCRVYDTLTPTENLAYSIIMQTTSSDVILRDCYLEKGRYGVGVYHSELVDMYEYRQQVFANVINHDDDIIHAFITGNGASQIVTTNISNPPGARNIWIYSTNVASPSGAVLIEGLDQFNKAVTDSITITPGGYAQG